MCRRLGERMNFSTKVVIHKVWSPPFSAALLGLPNDNISTQTLLVSSFFSLSPQLFSFLAYFTWHN